LDWHRYYPLAIGNIWEYHDEEAFGDLFRHTLLSDTTVGGRQYFRRATHVELRVWNDTLRWVSHDYVRYDTAGAVLAVVSPESDDETLDQCAEDDDFERPLRLGFGDLIACPTGSWGDSLSVQGSYNIIWTPPGGTPVEIAGWKWFVVGRFWSTQFLTDIGPVSAGNLWGPRLHYARIGGVEYGTPDMTVASEPSPTRAFTLAVTPNPARERAHATVVLPEASTVRIAVYDVLGREALLLHAGRLPAGGSRFALDASALPAGFYVARVTDTDRGGQRVRAFTVLR
jgi:hypothetical protein